MLDAQEEEFNSKDPDSKRKLLEIISERRGVSSFDTLRASSNWRVQRNVSIPALNTAVLLLMVRDETEIITQNLEHHYQLGFRRFFILDNASVDGTDRDIRNFRETHPDASVFYAYDYIVAYYQRNKMRALEAFISLYLSEEDIPPRWVFIVDADEFITFCNDKTSLSCREFTNCLNDDNCKLLVFHWALCSSKEIIDRIPKNSDIFQTFPFVWRRMQVPVTKLAFRLGYGIQTIQGNHMVEKYQYDFSSVKFMGELGLFMLHFPNRSIDQLRLKLTNGFEALGSMKSANGLGQHWRDYHHCYLNDQENTLRNILNEHITACTGEL